MRLFFNSKTISELWAILSIQHISRVKVKMNGEWYYANRSILNHPDYKIEEIDMPTGLYSTTLVMKLRRLR